MDWLRELCYNKTGGKTMKVYSNLSKPMMIGNVKIKNRMMMAPMGTGFGNNAWGGFTPEGVEYFAQSGGRLRSAFQRRHLR